MTTSTPPAFCVASAHVQAGACPDDQAGCEWAPVFAGLLDCCQWIVDVHRMQHGRETTRLRMSRLARRAFLATLVLRRQQIETRPDGSVAQASTTIPTIPIVLDEDAEGFSIRADSC